MNQEALSTNLRSDRFYLTEGNKKEINTSSGIRPMLIDGYSIRACCNVGDSLNCVPNLMSGNCRQKNNNLHLVPTVSFTTHEGAIGLGAYNRAIL